MKNTIEYYYNIKVLRIHQNGKNYYFHSDIYDYLFLPILDINSLNVLYNLSNYLYNSMLSHQIIATKDNQLYVKTNEENYTLLKIVSDKNIINYDQIFKLNSITFDKNENILRRDNWYKLWTNKVDYFEYQLNQVGKKYPLIRQSFSYYVGLAENAISLFNMTDKDKLILCLSHKRIKYNSTTYDLYNPLNFVIDYRIRDICEYFKDSFFNNKNVYDDIQKYLFYNNLSYDESCLFFSRMLYPSYYFDIYEKVLMDSTLENNLNKILSKTLDYEKLLKKVYYLLRQNNKLPLIEWLN
jgi:hypothetical protein